MTALSHLDAHGRAAMVDVSDKAATARTAVARGSISMQPETLALISEGQLPKGDVIAVARLAGIMAAKKTADLIPLCHPLALSSIKVEVTLRPDQSLIEIEATIKLNGRTGVEMEALTAVSVAALTLYDMCKAADRGMVIGDIRVTYKSGGRSGVWDAGPRKSDL